MLTKYVQLDPNHHGVANVPHWPEYGSHASNIVFNAHAISVEDDDFRKEGIAVLNRHPLDFLH